jgi:hypothetical protein
VATLFERLSKGRPAPAEAASKQPRSELESAQRLLDFLQRWAKDTVTAREIARLGPYAIRDRESAINSARTLVAHGWLIPLKAHRSDRRVWQIVRKPIIEPTVADSRRW